ncbi:MAG: exo-alpha-sialidase, partial [Calditrichaeota bacterium]|nr:exo-alpha-sialidase [Calditrichota bacterium]
MKRKLLKYTQHVVMPALLLTTLAFVNTQQKRMSEKINPQTPEGMRLATIQKKLNKRAKGYGKPDKPDEFNKFQLAIRSKIGEEKNSYEPGDVQHELQKAQQRAYKTVRSKQAAWAGHGPGNLGGRTRAIVVDKSDTKNKTWFAGSVGGGIWKTTNSGASWTNVSGDIANIAISSMVQSTSNPDVLYAGTGEGFGNVDAIYGNGILKSTDHGATWAFLPSTVVDNSIGFVDFEFVNRIIVDPSSANTVVAATNNGIYRSTDGGANWSQVLAGGRMQHIVATPGNFMVQYAAENGDSGAASNIHKSVNGGVNWSTVYTNSASGRIELAVARNNTNIVYAAVQDGNTGSVTSHVYRSDDAGTTWNPSLGSADWLSSQGWYDNAIAVDPFDDSRLLVGGVDLYKLEFGSTSTQYISNRVLNTDLLYSNLGGSELGGMLLTASDWNHDIVATKKHIQVKFGAGFSQKAHRFTRSGNTATYKDLVDVPFEVWDVEADTMLNVSFRDYNNDGAWNPDNVSRLFDYVFISNSEYNPAGKPEMMVSGTYSSDELNTPRAGLQYKLQNAFWVLTRNAFSVAQIEGSIIDISAPYTTYDREDTRISYWFHNVG